MNEQELSVRIRVLERRQKKTFQVAALAVIVIGSVLVLQWQQIKSAQHPEKLRVRELAVVDDRGTERALIAAPLGNIVTALNLHDRRVFSQNPVIYYRIADGLLQLIFGCWLIIGSKGLRKFQSWLLEM